MPKFKSPKGDIIEVDEVFAEQVLRPQGHYEEIGDDKVSTEIKAEVKSQDDGSSPSISTKKKKVTKKKATKKKSKKGIK